MKLPLALKSQLEESEKKFQSLLKKLGWEREDLEQAARRAKRPGPASAKKTAPGETAGRARGRIYHV